MAPEREIEVQRMLWSMAGATREAVAIRGDIGDLFRQKDGPLQDLVFKWMRETRKEGVTVEDFFLTFMYSIDCSVLLEDGDCRFLVQCRRDKMDGDWKKTYVHHTRRMKDPHHKPDQGLQCCNLHKSLY